MRILGLGMPELLLILVICLLIFGAAKLPEIGRSLGKTIKEFKKAFKEEDPGDTQAKNPDNKA